MNMDTKHPSGAQHETSDFNMKFVWAFAWTLLGLMFAGLFVAFLLYAGYSRFWTAQDAAHQPSRLAASLPARPPEPRLQELPAQDLRSFRARESAAQHEYGWVEPAAGVVRIPIERAMELVLQRGLPVRAVQGNEESGKGKAKAAPAEKQ